MFPCLFLNKVDKKMDLPICQKYADEKIIPEILKE